MQRFIIENKERELLNIIIEPWANEFRLKKGQVIELRQPNGVAGYYLQEIYADGDIQIYVEGNFDYPIILIDNKAI